MDPTQYMLGSLLKRVSRSFYLTLRVLPVKLRTPIGLAYLLARAADTLADTALVAPERRLEWLLWLSEQIQGRGGELVRLSELEEEVSQRQTDLDEQALLQSLGQALALLARLEPADADAVRAVVTTLISGMEFDLRTFPDERSGQVKALANMAELDRYTYVIAGCVGEFWTKVACAHTPELRGWDLAEMSRCGVRFGKALQLTNILRDCAKDLRIGRCYLPLETLAACGLSAQDLFRPEHADRARPALVGLTRTALDHYREAARYTLSLPTSCRRLRLACLWPILIGLRTLDIHARNGAWLDPASPSKMARREVYAMAIASLPIIGSNALIEGWIERCLRRVEASLGGSSSLESGRKSAQRSIW
jgi:farnesyl-diphosphate farnesyltransferase